MLDFVEWSPVHEIGLENEPEDAWAAEVLYDEEGNDLLFRYHNAVVYSDGSWKITHYDRGEQGMIIDGKEGTVKLAEERVEKELMVIWGKLGLV